MRTLSATLLVFVSASLAIAQESRLPDGLRHVPPDATGFIHFRLGAFLKSEFGKQLLQEVALDKEAGRGLKKIEQEIGIPLADIDSITVLMLNVPLATPFNSLRRYREEEIFRREMIEIERRERRMRELNQRELEAARRRQMEEEMRRGEIELEKVRRRLEQELERLKKDLDQEKLKRIPEVKPPPVYKFPQRIPGLDGSPVIFQEETRIALVTQPPMWAKGQDRMEFVYAPVLRPINWEALLIVTSTKDLDRKAMLKRQLFLPGSPNTRHEDAYPGTPASQSTVLFLSDRTAIFGRPWELARYSEQMAQNPGPKAKPMESALVLARKPHTLIAGGHVPAEMRAMLFAPFMPAANLLATIAPLAQTEAGLALDIGKDLDVSMQFLAPTDASAESALQAAKSLRTLGELALEQSSAMGEPGGWKLLLEKRLKQALASAVIEQKGTTVHAQLKMELDPVLVKRYTTEIVANIRSRGDRAQSVNNLKNIGLALHGFHDARKQLPSAGVGGPMRDIIAPDGKPLLSWRVAILPYIDELPLYNRFDFSQPWDHPTNKELIKLMPQVYVVPGAPESKETGMTHYRVLVGPQTMFEPGQRITLVGVTDGSSNTIMAVEANEPTIWTKPDDLPFDPKAPLPKFGVSPDGFHALFGDATVRFIRAGTSPDTVRAMITRNGNETVTLPD
jgi:hypothetical protein